MSVYFVIFFFFNDTATTEIYTLSLHDALPISTTFWPSALSDSDFAVWEMTESAYAVACFDVWAISATVVDRKSTRLNSSHANISYAVFCLKKKKTKLIELR